MLSIPYSESTRLIQDILRHVPDGYVEAPPPLDTFLLEDSRRSTGRGATQIPGARSAGCPPAKTSGLNRATAMCVNSSLSMIPI